jgi:pilus assembly protein Flp/PilA
MHSLLRRTLRRTEAGASAVEYAILVSLIAIVIIVAVAFLGRSTAGLFQKTCDSVASTQSSAC